MSRTGVFRTITKRTREIGKYELAPVRSKSPRPPAQARENAAVGLVSAIFETMTRLAIRVWTCMPSPFLTSPTLYNCINVQICRTGLPLVVEVDVVAVRCGIGLVE